MRISAILSCVVILFAASSCNTPLPPSTTLSLVGNGKPVDTAGLIDELKGLLSLTAETDGPNRSFAIKATKSTDTLSLAISPQLTAVHQHTLGGLLDTLINHPSPWSPSPLTLFYTGNTAEIVDLLKLDTVNGYPLDVDHASAQWLYQEKQTYMTGPLASSAALSYLDYRLKKPLLPSSYTLGLENTEGQHSEATDLVSSMLSAVGPISSSFSVKSADTVVTPLWDSLRVNQHLRIDSLQLSLNWAYVEFPYREFSPRSDRDTMITSSIEKLLHAPPYIFHALIAPRLSSMIKGYHWDSIE